MYTIVNKQQLYFQKTGSGAPLVFLHGWGQDVSTFWPIVPLLNNQFTLYLIDLPGFGRSELPKKPFYVRDYADTIAAFIQQEAITPIIFGHSLGGRVGIKLAATHPNILDKLILEDAAGIKPKQDAVKPIVYLLAKLFRYGMPSVFSLKEKLRYRLYANLESDYNSAGPLTPTLTNILAEDLSPDLEKIAAPTLLLWGENDRATPLADGKRMYRQIPKAKFVQFDGIGHFPHLEVPEQVCLYVKDFC